VVNLQNEYQDLSNINSIKVPFNLLIQYRETNPWSTIPDKIISDNCIILKTNTNTTNMTLTTQEEKLLPYIQSIDWGDGSSNMETTHTYSSAGQYSIILQLIDNITELEDNFLVGCETISFEMMSDSITNIGERFLANCTATSLYLNLRTPNLINIDESCFTGSSITSIKIDVSDDILRTIVGKIAPQSQVTSLIFENNNIMFENNYLANIDFGTLDIILNSQDVQYTCDNFMQYSIANSLTLNFNNLQELGINFLANSNVQTITFNSNQYTISVYDNFLAYSTSPTITINSNIQIDLRSYAESNFLAYSDTNQINLNCYIQNIPNTFLAQSTANNIVLTLNSSSVMEYYDENITNLPLNIVRVPQNLVDDYKTRYNWLLIADKIFPIT
jgi:hypothetical protein